MMEKDTLNHEYTIELMEPANTPRTNVDNIDRILHTKIPKNTKIIRRKTNFVQARINQHLGEFCILTKQPLMTLQKKT